MVAGTPEYHLIVKRVAAGRLLLGSIVDSRQTLICINRDEEIPIDLNRVDSFHDKNVEVSLETALTGNAGVAAKALALDNVGTEATIQRDATATYKIPDVYTWQFDAERSDYLDAVASPKVVEFLESTDYDPVYMITGLKIGSHVSVERTQVHKIDGRAGLNSGADAAIDPSLGMSKEQKAMQKGVEVTKRILAVRLRKLRYEIKGKLLGVVGGHRTLVDEPDNIGAELAGDRSRAPAHLEIEVTEEIDLDTEMEEYGKIAETDTIWIVPRSW